MIRRNRMGFLDRLQHRAQQAELEKEAGWHNGPSLVVPIPKEQGQIHPEVKRMMDLMQKNALKREGKLLQELEKLKARQVTPSV